ncbi:MAG: helix-turn-helix domain-containing protein [Ruminococcus sp.]|nr:helix-turn-helix domain-containing protein [Ruminococcus sp.]
MGFGKTLGEKIKEAGYTQSQIAEKVGMPKTTLNSLIKRDSQNLDVGIFLKICAAIGCDSNAFADECELEPLRPALTNDEAEFLEKYRKLNAQSKEIVTYILQKEADRDDLVPDIHMISVKTSYLPASAGHGEFLSEENLEVKDYVATPTALKADIVIPVSGDSMLPVYDDGDLLFVKRQPTIEVGEIGIFTVDGVGYVKKLGQGYLISLNPDYADIPLEGKEVYCVGKVLGKVEE